MNQFEGLLLLVGLSVGLLLSGYWLAALIDNVTPATRLAVAVLAGLASLIFTVSVVNIFRPLAGGWAWLCLAPIGATILRSGVRRRLVGDLDEVRRSRGVYWLAALSGLFLCFLLWPMLSHSQYLFYDGTSNHDSFFWISAAEHLKRHTYLEPPLTSATQPLTNAAVAMTTLVPAWGRMGAEGLLALASAVSWTSPIKLYLYATACLFVPWIAGVYLVIRTFWTERLSWGTKAALLVCQPVFVFFHSNANLPNLLGTLAGAAAVVATEQILRGGGSSRNALGWWSLLALSLHGLYCCYPEMVPFVLLPCGLLWIRACFVRSPVVEWRPLAQVTTALVASAALNPATTARAVHGFIESLRSARANLQWANMFSSVRLPEFLPALSTLSTSTAHFLGPVPCALLTIVVVASLGLAGWRARDRFGAATIFAGSLALATYTLATDFNYGWQKTVQFSGIFFAAAIPCLMIETQISLGRSPGIRRWLARAGLGLTVGFSLFATWMSCREIYKWSERKVISRDWFQLRDLSLAPGELRNAPVLVDNASFRMGFFYGMWPAYFLPESRLYFGSRGNEGGGYLHPDIVQEGAQPVPPPKAFLVARAWAEIFDANSPRMASGREYVLLRKSNRVTAMRGVFPLNGVPEFSSREVELDIQPHSPAVLVLKLSPRTRGQWTETVWHAGRTSPGVANFSGEVSGPPPWLFRIPLAGGVPNKISITLDAKTDTAEPLPFAINNLHVVNPGGVVPGLGIDEKP